MSKQKEENKRSQLQGPTLGFSENFPKRKMWTEIAEKLHGEFKIKQTVGRDIEIHSLVIPYKNWEIYISVSDSRPLKFQVAFSASQEFELELSWEDFIEKVLKKLGKREIELGWKEFDNRYLIKSKRSDLVKSVLTSDIQKTMLKHHVYSLSYQTNSTKRTAELTAVIQRDAGNSELITDLVVMFNSLIDNLRKSRVIS